MSNPDPLPHLMGITLDTQGVANSQVVAMNRSNGEKLILSTNGDKRVVFDAANFSTNYAVNDVIEFNNVGGSVGQTTITINAVDGGFQQATLDAAAAPTVSINL